MQAERYNDVFQANVCIMSAKIPLSKKVTWLGQNQSGRGLCRVTWGGHGYGEGRKTGAMNAIHLAQPSHVTVTFQFIVKLIQPSSLLCSGKDRTAAESPGKTKASERRESNQVFTDNALFIIHI